MIMKKQHGGARPGAGRPRKAPTKAVRLPVPLANFARELAAAKKSGMSLPSSVSRDAQCCAFR
jgi:hypothetical protein